MHGRRKRATGGHGHDRRVRKSKGPCPPWIFIHGTNILHRGLNYFSVFLLLFFGIFTLPSPPRKRLNSTIFRSFFFVGPLWKFFCRRSCVHVQEVEFVVTRRNRDPTVSTVVPCWFASVAAAFLPDHVLHIWKKFMHNQCLFHFVKKWIKVTLVFNHVCYFKSKLESWKHSS